MASDWWEGWYWGLGQASFLGLTVLVVLAAARQASATARVWLAFAGLLVLFALPWACATGISRVPGWSLAEWLGRQRPGASLSNHERQWESLAAATTAGGRDWLEWVDPWLLRVRDDRQPADSSGVEADRATSPAVASAFVRWWDRVKHELPQSWPRWIAWGLVACVGWGLLRLIVGWRMLNWLVRDARPLSSPAQWEEVRSWQARLGIKAPIEVLISDRLTTAAVVGCWRPKLVLPANYARWTAKQRAAVLAHELAHIASRDGAVANSAQVLLALNYFQPLAHLLVRRLRFDQELAADATAARLVGSRGNYLEQLALLALEQPPAGSLGTAHAFLPSRHMFLRRLEMLQTIRLRGDRWSMASTFVATLMLAGAVALTVGLRPLVAQESAAQATALPSAVDLLSYHPAELGNFVIDMDLGQLMAAPEWSSIREQLPLDDEVIPGAGISLNDLQRVVVWFRLREPQPVLAMVAIQTKQPLTADFSNYANGPMQAADRLDDHTVLFAPERALISLAKQSALQNRPQPLVLAIQQQANTVFRGACDIEGLRSLIQSDETAALMLSAIAPLYQDVSIASFGLSIGQTAQLRINAQTKEPKRVAETLNAAKTLLQNFMNNAIREMARRGEDEGLMMFGMLAGTAQPVLDSLQVKQTANSVEATLTLERASQVIGEILLPAVIKAREASGRARQTNNLKQIALAMHNYHSAYGHFPPAVLIGPKGHKYSWRVAILPFLEQSAMYQQYRLDEPWNSPHNLTVAATVPVQYAGGSADAAAGETLMHAADVLIEGDPKYGVKMESITDGLSNTLLVVRQSKPIKWTEPRDEPLPTELTDVCPEDGVVLAAMGDGAVRAFAKSLTPEVLKALRTPRGGEVIPQ